MISRQTRDHVLDRADIVEVIGDVVQLKKAGKDYRGLSPFTQEKTPSFYVVPSKGIFKDFSSGLGGDVIRFLMEYYKWSYPEAVGALAKRYGIDIKEDIPEDPEVQNAREQIFSTNLIASRYFSSQLWAQENALALEYLLSRFSKDDLIAWQIGAVPDQWTGLCDHAAGTGLEKKTLLLSNLAREKDGRIYDYFRNRIIFPILNNSGNIAGFGGRALPWTDEKAKYINSPDSPSYNKGRLLYGLYQARRAIIQSGICHLVEGYADVISMHAAGMENTVAPCGTSLTEDQALAIKKLAKKINLFFDGDTAGLNATHRAAEISLRAGLYVMVTRPPEGEDPGSFIRAENINWIEKNSISYISWRAGVLLKNTEEDPLSRHNALKEISRLILLINEKSLRDLFVQDLCSKNKLQKKHIQDLLEEQIGDGYEYDDDLPEDVDAREFERWGFYEFKNEFYFKTKEGIQRMSNFIMRPLFHVESTVDTRRIYELVNYRGFKVVVDFDMQEMTSLQAFRKNVEGKGNFLFWGTDPQFGKLKLKLYEQTRTCKEIKNLGWQKEGFWAWSNGIITAEGNFQQVDEYGLVEFEGNHYYIPAFSRIFLNDRSIFIDERRFAYTTRNITLKQWSEKFIEVFGENAKIGIAFWIASLFRDFILHIFKNFPMLNLFGPKGTGKSQMAMSLSCLFGKGQTPFNIHNGTKPGLAEHIQQFINAIAWVDEYKNSLEYDKIETLKSIYDSIGRSRLNMDKGKKKETTLVNSAVIISGQEMPTADVALFSRMIFLRFHKTKFSDEEKAMYDELKRMENDGLSHLSSEVILHRAYFEKNFYSVYEDSLSDMSDLLKDDAIEDRIIRNMATIIASMRTLESKLDLPFSYNDFKPIIGGMIKIQNSQVYNSNEISAFWNIMEAMFDDNIILDNWHFKVQFTDSIVATTREINFGSGNAKYVLKFKFNSIAKLYAEHSRRMGIKPLPSDTLRYYLENHETFICVEKSCRFLLTAFNQEEGRVVEQKQITTAYCFDYMRLNINLTRDPVELREKVNGENIIEEDNQVSITSFSEPMDEKNLPF